jgi:uncharacterized protein
MTLRLLRLSISLCALVAICGVRADGQEFPARDHVGAYSRIPYGHAFEAAQVAAKAGNVDAEVELGRHYENGYGVEQNLVEALNWYKKAAQSGNLQGILAVGLLLQNENLSATYKEAPEPWLLRAAEGGLAEAQIGESQFRSFPDSPKARRESSAWLERAARQGNSEAIVQLARRLIGSKDADERKRGAEYAAAAENAAPKWLFFIESARFFQANPHAGSSREKQPVPLPDVLHDAALKVDIEEMSDVGSASLPLIPLYMALAKSSDVASTRQSEDTLLEQLEASARAGLLQSACNLAFTHLRRKEYEAAAEWYRSAAERGAPRAAYHLGKLYRDGLGVPVDVSSAATWFYQAASSGYPPAQAAFGDLLLRGDGVPRDYDAARGWFWPAAAYGNPLAQYDLGLMYERGLGVGPDAERAVRFMIASSVAWDPHSEVRGRRGWPDALRWVADAESDPDLSKRIQEARKNIYPSRKEVDSATGGCDEQSMNRIIED